MDVKRYKHLKAEVARLQRDASKAEGAEEQLKRELKETFKVSTLKAAKLLLKQLKAEAEQAEKEFDAAMAKFEEEYGNQFEE